MTPNNTRDWRKLFKVVIFIVVFLGIAGYSYFEARDLIHGAELSIEIPRNGEVFTSSLISVSGSVGNIKSMSLNGRSVLTDSSGHFSEMVALGEGYNKLSVTITDRFNRQVTRTLEVVYEPTDTLTRLNPR